MSKPVKDKNKARYMAGYAKGIGAQQERYRALNPMPKCSRDDCDNLLKRRRSKFCSDACFRLTRMENIFPAPEIVLAAMLEKPLTTISAVSEEWNTNHDAARKFLSSHGIDVKDVREQVAARIHREQPFRKLEHIRDMLARGRVPRTAAKPAPREERGIIAYVGPSIVSGRSILEYLQTPEDARHLFADEVREAAERRMRR